MRSGNGRHRRPRQAPAIVVAAGVTGSAIALPLLGAGSASAAESATWDRVAECESGGLWSADFGNGQYGGLQFTQATWEQYGGLVHAPRADLASRTQQIAVAEKALAAQGVAPWATCAPIAGLTAGGEGSGADAGAEGTLPLRPDGTPAEPGVDPSQVTPNAPIAPEAPTAPATPSAPAGTGKHRGTPAPDETADSGTDPGNTLNDRESGRHASRSDAPTREVPHTDGGTGTGQEGSGTGASGDPANESGETTKNPETPEPIETPESGNLPESGESSDSADNSGTAEVDNKDNTGKSSGAYTVQPGDNLSVIAGKHNLDGGWTALYDANRQAVGADPDLIHPGQSLDLDITVDAGQAQK
ncbi:transglycosylase family protein [Streptomyces purpureus]|uniref:transglycosylase family protein n=1 Tax=Streptomyces purpureus TaxID=1951 RepID=UPI00378996B3